MKLNRETAHNPSTQPDSTPLASLGRSLQTRAAWSRRALSPWVQRRLESTQPGSSARARSFTLTRPPVQAMLVGQLQRTTEETLVSRPIIGSVNPLLVENFTQEVAGRHTQPIEPKYQSQPSDTWTNAPADLTWSGLAEAEDTQPAPPAPARLPFTVDQIRQAMERQQSGLPPQPITPASTPAPAPSQTVQTKRETNFPFSVAEVRAALEQPHFAKAPEIKRPSTPPSSPRQRRWVEEVTPTAPGPSAPAVDQPESFIEPSPPQPARPVAAPPASPPVQRQVARPRPPHLEPEWPSAEKSAVESELEETAPPSLASRSETVSPPPEESRPQHPSAPEALLRTESQPASLPRRTEAESTRPTEGSDPTQADKPLKFGPPPAQPQRSASAPVQRQMPSRPRPPRSEPVWQTLDPTNLPFNRMSEFDQPEPEPDEVFQGDEPAQTLAPAATGAESAPPSAKPSVQRQPDFAVPLQPEPSSLEMPLRWPQAEPDEVAQTIAPSASESETAESSSKPTVQRQPTFEASPQSEPPPVLEIPLRQVEPKASEAAQGVEPSSIEPSAPEGEAAQPPPTVQRQTAFAVPLQPEPSLLEMPLRWPQAEPDEVAQIVAPSASESKTAESSSKSTVQRRPTFEAPLLPEPSSLEIPLRQPEPKAGEAAQGVEPSSIEPSASEREAAQPPTTVQRQPSFEALHQPEPSSLEMPLRWPQTEQNEATQVVEPSQADALASTGGEVAAPLPDQPTVQHPPLETPPQIRPASTLEMPLRQPEPGPDETTDLSEITTSMTGREVTSPPSHPPVQRHLAFEPQTEPPSSLELPLRLPEIEPIKIVPPIESSQAAAPEVVESPVPSAYSQPAGQRQPIPEPQYQAETPSVLEMPLRFTPAEPGKAAQSVEPSPASAISQAAPPRQAAVQRQSEDETPLRRIKPEPVESPQTFDLSPTKTPDAEWSDLDSPEGMPLRQAETDRVHPARQIGVLPQVRQPFETRSEGMPAEPETTGESVLPLAQPTAARPEAAARLDMPLAAPPQPAPRAGERREEPPSSASTPAMSIQRYWEPEAVPPPAAAADSEAGPIQRVEDTEISFSEEPESPAAELDLDNLARQVYPLVKRMLAVERDRRPFR